jgi:SAM-dependent methyltransferase
VTFERLEPGTPEWIAYIANHEQRYAFAARQLAALGPNARVLDAATGVGYGASQLSAAIGCTVVGIDRDSHAIDVARARYGNGRVEFLQDDCDTLQAAEARWPVYDAVVSFETIEHLRDPLPFLRRVRSLLAPSGLFVASTPNRGDAALDRPQWDYHEREYAAGEFRALLDAAGFNDVALFGQQLTAIGELRRDLRSEINTLRFNPLARVGFWIQRTLRGVQLPPALPERPDDLEIVPIDGARPFVLIATARRPA